MDENNLYASDSVENLDLDNWARTALDMAGIATIGDLLKEDEKSLLAKPLMTSELIQQIRNKLKSNYGLLLRDEAEKAAIMEQTVGEAIGNGKEYSDDVLLLVDAMMKSHSVMDVITELSDEYEIRMLVLTNKLPDIIEQTIEKGVTGEDAILEDATNQLKDYIIQLFFEEQSAAQPDEF